MRLHGSSCENGNTGDKLEQISSCGYELLGYFELDEKTWWDEYFAPLEELILETRLKYPNAPGVVEAVYSAQQEIDMFKKSLELNSSVCFVMKMR